MVQQVKDPALSLVGQAFDPWLGTSVLQTLTKKKKKKKKSRKREKIRGREEFPSWLSG